MKDKITFRKLKVEDIDILHKWLKTEHVNIWYDHGENSTYDGVAKRYMPKINGEEPTHAFISIIDGKDIGYIQTYKISDFPDYAAAIDLGFDAGGMDLFIGEADYIHKGYGVHIMKKFMLEYVFPINDVFYCVLGPEPGNKSAIRAYEKVGFKYLKTVSEGVEIPEYLMGVDKAVLENLDIESK